jgi:hypothetical protein
MRGGERGGQCCADNDLAEMSELRQALSPYEGL